MALKNLSTKKLNVIIVLLLITSLLSLACAVIQLFNLNAQISSSPYSYIFNISSIFFLVLYSCLSFVVYLGMIKSSFLINRFQGLKSSMSNQKDMTSWMLYIMAFASIIIMIFGIQEIIPSKDYTLGTEYYQAEGLFLALSSVPLMIFSFIMHKLNKKFRFTLLPNKHDVGLILFLIYNVLILFFGFDLLNLLGFNVLNEYSITNDFHFRFLSFVIYYVVFFNLCLYLYMKGIKVIVNNNKKTIRTTFNRRYKQFINISIFIELILATVFITGGIFLLQIHYSYGMDGFLINDLFQMQGILLFLLSVSMIVLVLFNLKEKKKIIQSINDPKEILNKIEPNSVNKNIAH